MNRHHFVLALWLASTFGVFTSALAQDPAAISSSADAASPWLATPNVVTPDGLPSLGKWMLASDGIPSDWLGEIYRGKNLREPINVIIVDDFATDSADAISRLLSASGAAGYAVRMGHSVGYQAAINGQFHAQLPSGNDDAFSDGPFELSNNHGRIFGPVAQGKSFVFIGAFSREDVDLLRDPAHQYGSFNQARDDFTQNLDQATAFKITQFVAMQNAIINDPKLTTVEHDGMAVVVHSTK